MIEIHNANVIYFSGTGGTRRVASAFSKALSDQKISVTEIELKKGTPSVYLSDLLVVLFPVYAFNAPKPVEEWISSAPSGEGKPAVIISVSGGGEVSPNTACRVKSIRMLEGKGYDVIYEAMFVMPSNIFIPIDDRLSAMLLKVAPQKAKKAVIEILSNKRRRTQPFFLDRLFSLFGAFEKNAGNSFGTNLEVKENCTGCSLCSEHCSQNNIEMIDGKPRFGKDCVICLSCVYSCPQKAITPRKGKSLFLKDGFDLNKIENSIAVSDDLPPVEDMARGLLLKGIKKYLTEDNDAT